MKLFHCFVQTYIQTPLRFVSRDEDDKEEETAQAESKKKNPNFEAFDNRASSFAAAD